MGLPVRLLLHAPRRTRGAPAARAAFARIASLDQMMSDYRPDSELRRLEGRPGERVRRQPGAARRAADRARRRAHDRRRVRSDRRSARRAVARGARDAAAPGRRRRRRARALVGWRQIEIDRADRPFDSPRPGCGSISAASPRATSCRKRLRTLRDARRYGRASSKPAATSSSATLRRAGRAGRLPRLAPIPCSRNAPARSRTPRSRRPDLPRSSSRSTASATRTSSIHAPGSG